MVYLDKIQNHRTWLYTDHESNHRFCILYKLFINNNDTTTVIIIVIKGEDEIKYRYDVYISYFNIPSFRIHWTSSMSYL